MLSQVKQSDLPSYQSGLEQGECRILIRQIKKRFGQLLSAMEDKITRVCKEPLEHWADNILDAKSLSEVFQED